MFNILKEIFPKLPSFKTYEEFGFGIEKIEALDKSTSALKGTNGFIIFTLWILAFVFLIIYTGFIFAILLSNLIFFKFVGKLKWMSSIPAAVGLTAVNYIFVEIILGITFFEGYLFGGKILL
jgi:hypothetical protein